MNDNKHNYDEILKYPGSNSQDIHVAYIIIYIYSTSVYNDNTISLMTTENVRSKETC